MDRLLVIGASGMLGRQVMLEAASRELEATGTFSHTPAVGPESNPVHLDVTDEAEVRKVIEATSPTMVLLASGLTDIDYCQAHPQEAWSVNAEGTFNVAVACKKAGARLMYVSTDAVFNGEKDEHYFEFDTPDPLSIYAQTKLEGERLTVDADHRNSVCRVSVLYGWNGPSGKSNFVTWVLGELRAGRPVDLYADRRSSPTYVPDCARVLVTMLLGGARGIYHIAGPDCLDRHSMGLKVAEVFGLDPGLCRKVPYRPEPPAAPRGRNLCLSSQKAEAEFDLRLMGFEDGLKAMLRSPEGPEPIGPGPKGRA